MGTTLKKLILRLLPISLTLVLIAIVLMLIDLASKPEQANLINNWLIPVTIFTLLLMLAMVIGYTTVIIRRLRTKETGSRYTLKLMSAFSVFTILPVLIVSYFSMNFIGDSIDDWFNMDVEAALEDAIELSERSIKKTMVLHLRELDGLSKNLSTRRPIEYQSVLDKVRKEIRAYEIVILTMNQRVTAYSADSTDQVIPRFPGEEVFRSIVTQKFFFKLQPDIHENLYSRIGLLMHNDRTHEKFILTAIFPVPQMFSDLSSNISRTRDHYKALNYHRSTLKFTFRLALLIVMMMSILFALWAAFLYTQRLAAPVKNLVDGTLAVASGDLQKKLPVSHQDDFSLLARSFNTMTTKLSLAMHEIEQSREEVSHQNDYLNIVLNHLTSGVITLDENSTIKRINNAALQLLELDIKDSIDKKLQETFHQSTLMPYFIDGLIPFIEAQQAEWKTEIITVYNNRRRVFICRGVQLTQISHGSQQGSIIVFEDVTELIEAEHEAAWGEVARRLAHEIKNPLTPIQLSAERLQHRLSPQLDEKSSQLLSRMTQTIIQQVSSMKSMVNAFSQYARSPNMDLAPSDINSILHQVAELYQHNENDIQITLHLQAALPTVMLDQNKIRQVFVNLVKNAIEAVENTKEDGTLSILTKVTNKESSYDASIVIQFIDNGAGFALDMLPKVFEPYISSKVKGTGLGLAIVKKIIEEHSGKILAKNHPEQGAIIEIQLPITAKPKSLSLRS